MRDVVSKFIAWLTTLAPKAVTAEDMLFRFGPKSPSGRAFITWSYELYSNYSSTQIISESFEVWKGLYKEATNLDDEAKEQVTKFAESLGIKSPNAEQFLFAVQTHLAILMKLLVAEVAVQKGIINSTSLRVLLGRNAVEGYRSLNQKVSVLTTLFEEDVFDWFLEPAKFNRDADDAARDLLLDNVDALDGLDFRSLQGDLVRDLYHGFFDRSTRRALGEFYTNEEIVNGILDDIDYSSAQVSISKGEPGILLDASCGSGTFLVGAINRWSKLTTAAKHDPAEAARVLGMITQNVVGIDIHPFAVTMARVNYLLAILDLLTPDVVSQLGDLRIPVYWSDSLLRATTLSVSPIVDVSIPILGSFQMPDPAAIPWDEVASNIRRGLEAGWDKSRFVQEFGKSQGLTYQGILENLYDWFDKRDKAGRDGRWVSVLVNASIVHALQGKCGFVVGNPPWVRIHVIDESIRGRLKEDFEYYKGSWKPTLRKTKVRFAEQYDYCLAFVESGLKYLKDDGKLGFVITSKVMQALYAGQLRKDVISNHTLIALKDYSSSGVELFKDATTYPLILALAKTKQPRHDTDVTVLPPENRPPLSWKTKQDDLPLARGEPGSPWLLVPPKVRQAFRRMQGSSSKLGDDYDVMRGVTTSANPLFVVTELRPTVAAGEVTVTTEGGDTFNIESSLIRPFVKGEGVRPWQFTTIEWLMWTHDAQGDVLASLPPRAGSYFQSKAKELRARDDFKALSKRQPNTPIWTIFRVNSAKMNDKVGWRELAPFMQAVFIPSEVGFKTPDAKEARNVELVVDHTTYFVVEPSEDLSYSLAGLFNSTLVRAYMQSFAAKARGGWFRHFSWSVGMIPLPSGVKRLEGSSKKAHEYMEQGDDEELRGVQAKLDAIVCDLYGLSEDEFKAVKDYHEKMTPTSGVSTEQNETDVLEE